MTVRQTDTGDYPCTNVDQPDGTSIAHSSGNFHLFSSITLKRRLSMTQILLCSVDTNIKSVLLCSVHTNIKSVLLCSVHILNQPGGIFIMGPMKPEHQLK